MDLVTHRRMTRADRRRLIWIISSRLMAGVLGFLLTWLLVWAAGRAF